MAVYDVVVTNKKAHSIQFEWKNSDPTSNVEIYHGMSTTTLHLVDVLDPSILSYCDSHSGSLGKVYYKIICGGSELSFVVDLILSYATDKTINIDFNASGIPTETGYNRVSTLSSVALNDSSGAASGITIDLGPNWIGFDDTGVTTGNNTGVVPDSALATHAYGSTSIPCTIALTGLVATKHYVIEVVGSKTSTEVHDELISVFANSNAIHHVTGNTAKSAKYYDITGVTSATVTITPRGGKEAVVSAMIIKEVTVTPRNLFVANVIDTVTITTADDYYIQLPYGYTPECKYPLLVFFPGSGEVGGDPSVALIHGPLKSGNQPDVGNKGLICVAVHYLQTSYAGDEDTPKTKALIDEISANYSVDKAKICITGLSLGGRHTFEMLRAYGSSLLASAIPIANGEVYASTPLDNYDEVATWGFMNEGDTAGGSAQKMVDFLMRNLDAFPDNVVLYTIYVGDFHGGWTETYANTGRTLSTLPQYAEMEPFPGPAPHNNIYTWLIDQRNSNYSFAPPISDAGVDKNITYPQNYTTLDGSGSSDPLRSVTTYLWEMVSGPGEATESGNDTPVLTLTNLLIGTYVYRLTLTDNDGLVSHDDAIVTVFQATSFDATHKKMMLVS